MLECIGTDLKIFTADRMSDACEVLKHTSGKFDKERIRNWIKQTIIKHSNGIILIHSTKEITLEQYLSALHNG